MLVGGASDPHVEAVGERLYGPRAVLLAGTRHRDLTLPSPTPPTFPLWHAPRPPMIDPSWNEDRQHLFLRRRYVATMVQAGYDQKTATYMVFGRPGRRPLVVTALRAAAQFCAGTTRPGLKAEVLPAAIAPHCWCAWSATFWRAVQAKVQRKPSRLKPPPIHWVYGPGRLRNPRTVNIFTHWPDGDLTRWLAPLRTQASRQAEQIFSLYSSELAAYGWERRDDLVRFRAKHLGWYVRYEQLSELARVELKQMQEAANKLIETGSWVWG